MMKRPILGITMGDAAIILTSIGIIAATNQNLSKMVEEGKFRSDLYYRLNILRIHMPTLAERKEDIPLLADKLLQKMQYINPNLKSITEEAKSFLSNCKWPGNIRQFVNMMERIMLLTDGDTITKQDVINAYEDDKESLISNEKEIIECTESINTVDKNLAQMEIELLHKILVEENYNYTKAAKRLGIHRTTLWRKLKNK